ncbi:unnamed protein product [Gadus morhua 'NCC']
MKTRWRSIFLKALEVKSTFAPVVVSAVSSSTTCAYQMETLWSQETFHRISPTTMKCSMLWNQGTTSGADWLLLSLHQMPA